MFMNSSLFWATHLFCISKESEVKTVSKSIERFDRQFVHKLRHVSGYCDLDIWVWPKVINFNRVGASAVSNQLAKTASKLLHKSTIFLVAFNSKYPHYSLSVYMLCFIQLKDFTINSILRKTRESDKIIFALFC